MWRDIGYKNSYDVDSLYLLNLSPIRFPRQRMPYVLPVEFGMIMKNGNAAHPCVQAQRKPKGSLASLGFVNCPPAQRNRSHRNHLATNMTRAILSLFIVLPLIVGCGGYEAGTPVELDYSQDCETCGGTGRIEGSCAICNGDGHRTSGVLGGETIMCSACGGTGSVAMRCSGCGGSGRLRIER